jgi:hypothetical protein
MHDLNDLVHGSTEAVITQARGINNRGEIAVNVGGGDVTHAGLLTPTRCASAGQQN